MHLSHCDIVNRPISAVLSYELKMPAHWPGLGFSLASVYDTELYNESGTSQRVNADPALTTNHLP